MPLDPRGWAQLALVITAAATLIYFTVVVIAASRGSRTSGPLQVAQNLVGGTRSVVLCIMAVNRSDRTVTVSRAGLHLGNWLPPSDYAPDVAGRFPQQVDPGRTEVILAISMDTIRDLVDTYKLHPSRIRAWVTDAEGRKYSSAPFSRTFPSTQHHDAS